MEWLTLICLAAESKRQADETGDAIRYSKAALEIAKKNGSKKEESVTLLLLADIYNQNIENYPKAVDYYQKGLEIVQETGDKHLEYEISHGIGSAFMRMGDYEKSMKYNKQSFVAALKTGDSLSIATSYNGLGNAYSSLCDYQNSIKCLKKAIDLFRELNYEQHLGACYGDLAESYRMQGKYHDSIRFAEESLKVNVKLGNRKLEAANLHHLGNVYRTLNDFDKAIELYQKSLTISKEINHKGIQVRCYCSLGNIMLNRSSYEEAILNYRKCLDIAVQIDDKLAKATASINVGNCLKKLNRHNEAIEEYNQSLRLAMEMKDKNNEALVYFNIADIYVQMSGIKQAIDLYEKCLVIANTIGKKELEGKACSALGEIYHSLHKRNQGHQACNNTDDNIVKSEQYLRKALDCFDFLFQHLYQRDHLKVSIFDDFTEDYKLLTTVLIETDKVQEALLVSDGGRARALGDRLIFKYGMIRQEYSSPNPLTYSDVKAVLLNDTFTMLHYNLFTKRLAVWILAKDSIVLKQSERQDFDSAIEALNPEEKGNDENSMTRFFTDTITRAYEMMKIKESVTCENRSLDDCVTSKDHVTTKASKSQSRDDGASEEKLDQESLPIETLYNCLVAPVLSDVKHDEIVIVPDGPMYRVPFAALRDPNTGQYLSDTKRIRLAPSIAILKALNECPVDHHSQKGAFIVGDPSVGEVKFRGKKRVFERLPSANREVTFLSGMLRQSTKLTGEQATKDAVLEKLKEGSAVIHIAAHGSSDNGEIMLAPNVSSEREIPEEDDYLLTMKEVQQIGIKAQLVVLSCCYSGRGEIRAEGMVGLSRAFLAAGARSVVASLWAIDDSVTFSFMLLK
ncbi:Tetratricopeptide repeat protein 28 [Exaiptasia diaphana]|nr:Tetratricopeptide repeat protein 28 [Exaiptasia diaphana]